MKGRFVDEQYAAHERRMAEAQAGLELTRAALLADPRVPEDQKARLRAMDFDPPAQGRML